MNREFVKDIYRKIGLSESSIDNRIQQSDMLSTFNKDPHVGTGGGVACAYDSVTGSFHAPLVVKDLNEAILVRKALENMNAVAMDSDTYAFNIPSSGVPLPVLTIWTTRMIEQMYKKTTLSLLAGSWQQGSPGVEEIKIPTMSYAGKIGLYNDYSQNGSTSININWVTRNIIYFEESLVWGDMQQAQFELAKIDYVNKLREALSITVGQFQNDLGFQGYAGITSSNKPQLFGILNEPNLNPAISLPASGIIPGTTTLTTAWYGKSFNQLVTDVQLLFRKVMLQTEGQADINSKCILALPPSAESALATPNPISSQPFREYLRQVFPNMEIVITPNFEASLNTTGATTNQTVVMLLLQHPNGEMPYDELFVTKWQGHRPVPMASSISEKISFGLGGVILKYPAFVTYAFSV